MGISTSQLSHSPAKAGLLHLRDALDQDRYRLIMDPQHPFC